ncbi:MAG: regulatory protein RecX [Candidatus Levybacteria bacterium]|nr:regulatory protein RecX [Candidatus Levybacteria bacterium]MDZ4228022.1 regulatory protein RecX [Candidatus Levybacteria bacterium]
MDNSDFEKFYNKALKFLSYRPRSEKEVRDRLRIKIKDLRIKDTGQLIDDVIEKLKKQRFINDEEFARLWVENRLRFKPRSSRLIKLELKQKGINPETINSLQLTIDNDLDSARKLVEKRIGRLKGLEKQEIYEKLGRFLASRGFNWDTIKRSVDEVLGKGV